MNLSAAVADKDPRVASPRAASVLASLVSLKPGESSLTELRDSCGGLPSSITLCATEIMHEHSETNLELHFIHLQFVLYSSA